MTYVIRDPSGRIVAVSHLEPESLPGDKRDWVSIDDAAPELAAFIDSMSLADGLDAPGRVDLPVRTALAHTDIGMVRVLEDLIDLLIDQGVIVFTDLPLEAQNKLSERQSRRAQLRRISLMDDDSDLI